ncbi:MAG: sigma-70 family RNA polymerase sigma factor [Deltaproteobacteria bacterium]|nr:sigma-70 family RNA polymerase sigma factor [Deltaproteobacteria bacterium]
MSHQPASDEMARQLRTAWFTYVDTIEPVRPALYGYCRRLTGDVWEAEDLLQETLLRGFGAIGRGDLHGDSSRVKDARAYLFRVATNLWIDQLRRNEVRFDREGVPEPSPTPEQAVATREAASQLFTQASPQQRAAIVLKDIFDFTAEEIAVMLSTSVGAVKSALHRGRTNLKKTPQQSHGSLRAPSRELIDRVVAAFNARDVDGITNLLLENVTLDVPGVGGERGKNMIWVRASLSHPSFRSEPLLYQGEWIFITWDEPGDERVLAGVTRFEEQDRAIARIREYVYCPETLNEVAAELGVKAAAQKYHQDPATLQRMIAASNLPWRNAV